MKEINIEFDAANGEWIAQIDGKIAYGMSPAEAYTNLTGIKVDNTNKENEWITP